MYLLAGFVAACGSEPARSRIARVHCDSRPTGSRWAGPYVEKARFGSDGARWLNEVGGIAVAGSRVFVYDAPEAQVTILEDSLIPIRTFGRKGRGPGEMVSTRDRGLRGQNWRWITSVRDTVVLFDGTRFQMFDGAGKVIQREATEASQAVPVSSWTDRVAYRDGFLIASEGGYGVVENDPHGQWRLVAHGRPSDRVLLSLHLTAPPRDGGGAIFIGPAQARPLWDEAGGCVAATDGASGWLIRGTVAGAAVDTVAIAYPAASEPPIDRQGFERLMGGKYMEPTARRRASGLIIDPDGYAWLLPWQDSTHIRGAVEVVRVSMATGAAERDTVPAFPAAFGAPGVYYAVTNDRHTGEAYVTRYDAAFAGPPRQVARR